MSSADESCKKVAKMITSSSIHPQRLPKQTFIVPLNKFAILCFSRIWFYEPYTVQCVTPRQLKWVERLMTLMPLMIHKRIEVKETPFKTFKEWHDMKTSWKLLACEGILAVFPDNIGNFAKLPAPII